MSRTTRRQGTKSSRRTARTVSKERRFRGMIEKRSARWGFPSNLTPSQLRKAQRRGLL
jgi:hypothetical protein